MVQKGKLFPDDYPRIMKNIHPCEIEILHHSDKRKMDITPLILYAGLILIAEQIIFCNLGSPTNFKNLHFCSKKIGFFLVQNFGF